MLLQDEERHGRGGGVHGSPGGAAGIQAVVAGANTSVDNTDPQNPIINADDQVQTPAGFSFQYTLDVVSTADSDPGQGFLRFNNADKTLATQIFIDLQDAHVADLTDYLDSLTGGIIKIMDFELTGKFIIYTLNSVSAGSGYRKLNVTYLTSAGASSLSTDPVGSIISFSASGGGSGGGDSGMRLADGAVYESGFCYVGYEHETDGSWYIYRRTLADNTREYASGVSGYDWSNRALEIYT